MDFSTCVDHSTFGPTVEGCRQDSDFTLKSEKTILSVLPSAVFIALSIPRAILFARRPTSVDGVVFQSTKVCLALITLITEAAISMLIIIRTSGARLHEAALRTLVSAPLRFFSKTDTGVVTNLFSQDMTVIDGNLVQMYTLLETSIGANENLALRDLTMTIEPGQKVAMCGRTGSGKSSVVLLLLRLLDPVTPCTGDLIIDGVSLRTIDRSTPRQRIIAVPQDPTFFPDGTSLRSNLDPFTAATDKECKAVLEAVGLWPLVSDRGELTAGLTADTLSHGQKQLFSLTGAVLRRRGRARELAAEVGDPYVESSASARQAGGASGSGGVLILDEFTSSVNVETEKTVEEIIWRKSEAYTIIISSSIHTRRLPTASQKSMAVSRKY
ncbi:hypothetical protein VMCG_06839 [Cytospora schulzeri]|uniref:ABC transporter domain-containing protein n=1 Tax=Cytospora schulzeri TaxID=448051 RepID=A0A423W298_9PEZI|nr:hypothetical protein VMCG_06839 [Valsa malicola]